MVQRSRYLLSLDPRRSTLNRWAMAHVKCRLTRSQDQIKIIWWHCGFTSDLAMLLHCFCFWMQVGLFSSVYMHACVRECVCVCVISCHWSFHARTHTHICCCTSWWTTFCMYIWRSLWKFKKRKKRLYFLLKENACFIKYENLRLWS